MEHKEKNFTSTPAAKANKSQAKKVSCKLTESFSFLLSLTAEEKVKRKQKQNLSICFFSLS
jgi:hypothetical protein